MRNPSKASHPTINGGLNGDAFVENALCVFEHSKLYEFGELGNHQISGLLEMPHISIMPALRECLACSEIQDISDTLIGGFLSETLGPKW